MTISCQCTFKQNRKSLLLPFVSFPLVHFPDILKNFIEFPLTNPLGFSFSFFRVRPDLEPGGGGDAGGAGDRGGAVLLHLHLHHGGTRRCRRSRLQVHLSTFLVLDYKFFLIIFKMNFFFCM